MTGISVQQCPLPTYSIAHNSNIATHPYPHPCPCPGFWLGKEWNIRQVDHHWSQMTKTQLLWVNLSFGIMAGALAGFNVTFTKDTSHRPAMSNITPTLHPCPNAACVVQSIFAIMGEILGDEGFGGLFTTWITYVCGSTLLITFVAQVFNRQFNCQPPPYSHLHSSPDLISNQRAGKV